MTMFYPWRSDIKPPTFPPQIGLETSNPNSVGGSHGNLIDRIRDAEKDVLDSNGFKPGSMQVAFSLDYLSFFLKRIGYTGMTAEQLVTAEMEIDDYPNQYFQFQERSDGRGGVTYTLQLYDNT